MAPALTPKTTIGTLLKDYPFLVGFLADYHPELKKLTNPVMRHTVGRTATLERVAAQCGVPLERFLSDVAAEVARVTGERPETATSAAAGIDPVRQEELKAIITALHTGSTPDDVKPRFAALIGDIDASEIAAMEEALMAEGLPEDEVKRLCDVHVQVFADALEDHEPVTAPEGHPIDTFQRENQALLQITQSIRKVAERIGTSPGAAEWQRLKPALASSVDRLLTIDRHYLRKENQLFPFLEKHGVEGPAKVMWALHDDIRGVLKELRGALAADDAAVAVHAATEAAIMADDMVVKEEKILFPMAVDTLSEAEWREIRAGEPDIGYSLITDVPSWPGAATEGAAPAPSAASSSNEFLQLHTGGMSVEQLNLMLGKLPLDVSFVDEHDEVRFYSEGERVFPRSPAVIGRKVQNCHPPASVHKVQAIIDAFRAGREETAEFWLTLDEKFLYIRYFALRDAEGAYRGVLETVQNVTAIRALEGQRRLLDW
jgi:uncharacterized protein